MSSITNTAVFVFFFLLALLAPVYGQYGTADGDLLSGTECTIGLQSPSISKECASCNVKNMPGFRDFFVNNGMGQCNNLQIMNYWVHGGMGAAGPHNFYEGDIAPHICKSVCACELADRNADCGDSTAATIAPTTKPTLIPTRIPTIPPTPTRRPTFIPTTVPTVVPIPTTVFFPTAVPTIKIIKINNTPIQNNTPKIIFPKLNIKEKSTAFIRFFTSIFVLFFKEASF
ncbi:hypothetical protein HZA75_05740 [Candidatus Roizmanbacteria bacterium]|nr:hypothetical protein [Candidatus Roizmanbacteria bacterium]